MNRYGLGFSILLGALIAAGCGDDGKPLTKEQFITKADAICAEANEKRDPIEARADSAIDSNQFGEAADRVAEVRELVEQEFDDLRALNRPESRQIDRLFDVSEKQLELVPEFEDALRDGDISKITELGTRAQTLDSEANSIQRDYGFQVCGQD